MNHFAVQVEDFDELDELDELEVHEQPQANGAKIGQLIDHGMTKIIYFRDPENNSVEFFFNTTQPAEEGLAMMRAFRPYEVRVRRRVLDILCR